MDWLRFLGALAEHGPWLALVRAGLYLGQRLVLVLAVLASSRARRGKRVTIRVGRIEVVIEGNADEPAAGFDLKDPSVNDHLLLPELGVVPGDTGLAIAYKSSCGNANNQGRRASNGDSLTSHPSQLRTHPQHGAWVGLGVLLTIARTVLMLVIVAAISNSPITITFFG